MKHAYAHEEAKVTGRPPEIEMRAYNIGEDFGRASVGIVECRGCHGRIKNPVSDRVYLVLEGEETFYCGGEEGQDEETAPVGQDDVLLMPKEKIYDYEGRTRLFLSPSPAYKQDSDVHHDDLWG